METEKGDFGEEDYGIFFGNAPCADASEEGHSSNYMADVAKTMTEARTKNSDKNKQPQGRKKQGDFLCSLCNVSAPYDNLGTTPPYAKSIVLLEKAYVMKDPFAQGKEGHLVLGATCCLCDRCVCLGQDCSLFYTKRFCLPCVLQNIQEFPAEIREEVAKKKSLEKPR